MTVCQWHCPFSHAVSLHLIPWPEEGKEWHYYAVSSHHIPWPIESECHCPFSLPWSLYHISPHDSIWVSAPFFMQPNHHTSSHDQQGVSGTAFFLPCSLISSHDQQHVSDAALAFSPAISFSDEQQVSVTALLFTQSHWLHVIPINRLWVTLPIFVPESHPMTKRVSKCL